MHCYHQATATHVSTAVERYVHAHCLKCIRYGATWTEQLHAAILNVRNCHITALAEFKPKTLLFTRDDAHALLQNAKIRLIAEWLKSLALQC